MNKKGFTLIELLAVIIILGILMIIAIPSVTQYINNSRKSAYIDTAKEIISGARNLVNQGDLEMFDTDTTYYIDINCIGTENGSKSPYGDFSKAYVVVTYDGKSYNYYWTSVDETGQGVKKITKLDKLDEDSIVSDLKNDDIQDTYGIDGRNKYMIISKSSTNCGVGTLDDVSGNVNGENGNEDFTAAQEIKRKEGLINAGGATRYVGANPNNYVLFNNDELWRIIGVYGNNLKVIRASSVKSGSYNSVVSNGNDWNNSDLKTYLNETYYDSLLATSKNMIEEKKWYLGRTNTTDVAQEAYEKNLQTDNIWIGKIALINLYEYLFSATEDCYDEIGNQYGSNGCAEKDWLYLNGSDFTWVLNFTPSSTIGTILISGSGGVATGTVGNSFPIFPVVYLKSTVKITGGEGTIDNPYTLN